MYLSFPVQISIYTVSALMSISIFVFFLVKGRRSPLFYSFVLFQFVILFWLLFITVIKLKIQLFPVMGSDFSGFSYENYEYTHYQIKYLIICFAGLSWLLFCLLYTGRTPGKGKKPLMILIAGSFLMFYLPVYINSNWLYYELAPKLFVFWLHQVARYAYFSIGIAVLVMNGIKQTGNSRKQSLLLAAAVLFPIALNFIQDYKRFIMQSGGIVYDFDMAPVGFIITMTVIAFAIYKYRFLDTVPIALRRIVNNMNQAIVVIDAFNKIVDHNRAFCTTFPMIKSIRKNADLETILGELEAIVEKDNKSDKILEMLHDKTNKALRGEICVTGPEIRYLTVDMQPLNTKSGQVLVRLISFSDITEYKKLVNEINEKNTELKTLYEQTKEYASTVEELTLARERNRFARDIHDTLGHTLTLLIALLEVSNITCGKDNEKTQEKLKKAGEVAREGLMEVRRSISGLAPERLDSAGLVDSLGKLIADFRSSGVNIDFAVDGVETHIERVPLEALYRSCQEAVTNSIRHGSARHIDIILKFSGEKLKLFIIDDGKGCKQIKKGYGLSGMEQRIVGLGGSVVYGSDGETGFNVHIEVPLQKLQVQNV